MPIGQTLDHPLAAGNPPRWASAWGEDCFGPWVEISVNKSSQRLRWIRPGAFMMGVSENEEHYDWEDVGQRKETISKGFWLFDTACTQRLWEAVMGNNPSHFKDDRHPVETVSWEDVHQFINVINERLPGLNLALPREVQWEYACRAGTTGIWYVDDLDSIAWYADNSQETTHNVAEKKPNKWGLYDTLGNVYEWCEDKYKSSDESSAAIRLFRGGSFANSALLVRAAYRNAFRPSLRLHDLGFRCSSSGSVPVGRTGKWGV